MDDLDRPLREPGLLPAGWTSENIGERHWEIKDPQGNKRRFTTDAKSYQLAGGRLKSWEGPWTEYLLTGAHCAGSEGSGIMGLPSANSGVGSLDDHTHNHAEDYSAWNQTLPSQVFEEDTGSRYAGTITHS